MHSLQQLIQNEMEDSLELPASDDQQLQEINFMISPNISQKKMSQKFHLLQSQESLAYSNETQNKYLLTDRSPITIPNFENIEKGQEGKEMEKAGKNIEIQIQREKKRGQMERQRKTIDKNQILHLSMKNKQLQYALQVQMIQSEELRSKVSILSQLLEEKVKNAGLQKFLKLNNSSKSLKNIDIFIQLQKKQKEISESKNIIQKQKQQIHKLMKGNTIKQANENIDYENMNLVKQVQSLKQQKQSLFSYIQELKKEFKGKCDMCEQLERQIEHFQQKQEKFTSVERPKFIQELSSKSKKVKSLEEQLQMIKMQHNLTAFNYQSQITQLQQKLCSTEESQPLSTELRVETRTTESQTHEIVELEMLKAQTILLKTERDYYLKEYKKKVEEISGTAGLKLELGMLRKRLEIISK